MGGSTLDMTKGSPWKLITQFAVPVFLSQVFQQLYNTADALIVGRFLGDEALAAVSASGPLIFLLISFFTGLSMGAGVTISRYFGAGDYGRVSKAIHTDVMLGLLSGTVLTVVGVLLTPTFLRWMGTAPEVLPDAIAYFQYYFFGVLAVVMYNMCTSIMNALGDSKRPLYYLIISSLTNIVLDLLFIGGFGWGVWAAAVATTISQAVSMVLCLIHLMKKGTIYQLKLKELRIDGEMLGQIVRYGLPSGVQNSVIGFANVIVQSNINSFGKVAMAAYGAYSKLEGFAFLPVTSFTMALTTFVGQNYGADNLERARKGNRQALIMSIVISVALSALAMVLARPLISLFTSEPDVLDFGVTFVLRITPFYALCCFNQIYSGALRGIGNATTPTIIMLCSFVLFRQIYLFVNKTYFGNSFLGMSLAYPMGWIVCSILIVICYRCSAICHPEKREKLKKQIAALENKMRREKQLNRRMEMNAELKQLQREWRK